MGTGLPCDEERYVRDQRCDYYTQRSQRSQRMTGSFLALFGSHNYYLGYRLWLLSGKDLAPKGLKPLAQGFNPGNPSLTRSALQLKGRQKIVLHNAAEFP
jgi:hypothetical protein